jgi:hypothetical protein
LCQDVSSASAKMSKMVVPTASTRYHHPCHTKPAAGMSRVDPGHLQGPGSTRLRVASSVTKDHVRELKEGAMAHLHAGVYTLT